MAQQLRADRGWLRSHAYGCVAEGDALLDVEQQSVTQVMRGFEQDALCQVDIFEAVVVEVGVEAVVVAQLLEKGAGVLRPLL
ncbi:hypothetical protein ACQP1G_00825 [Nocardia sp. CA-107356]|uniref:hypothetical protein n=1 Tax=Nocardia sp. CA-107356 TaxID=3239972 RepID=UPI003D89C15B